MLALKGAPSKNVSFENVGMAQKIQLPPVDLK